MKKGFSTIELMIAMAIMVLVLSAVVMVSFGTQSFLSGSQTDREAMNKAQELLEREQALARKDFNLVNSIAAASDDIYTKTVSVNLLPDLLTKEVKATISWADERKLTQSLDLTTLISNFDTPVGGNTCSSSLSGNWSSPSIENTTTSFATLVNDPTSTYTISDIDAYKGKLYVTASNTSTSTKPTFFIFDLAKLATDPTHALLGSMDNEVSGGTSTTGLSAVRVSEDPASNPQKIYAYATNMTINNYATCTPATNKNCGQLDIFDVTNPSSPTLGSNLAFDKTLVKGTAGQSRGNSIYYRNGYLLIGLTANGGNGPEFHIVDVHNPSSLFGGSHIMYPVGSYTLGNDVNNIAMRGNYVYLVTPNTQELQILDISNPSSPYPGPAGSYYGFNSSTGAGNGKSIYLVGDRIYLGKTVPNAGNDLHVLNNKSPNTVLAEISGKDMASSVNAIIVRSNLAFVLSNNDLEIFDIGDGTSVSPFTMGSPLATLAIPANGNAVEPSMDCEGNKMYISSNDASGKGALYVIKPGI